MTTESTFEAINDLITKRLADTQTAMPGIVVSFDGDANTVDVQPVFGADRPVIPAVPIAYPGAVLTYPLAAGDTVLLVFCSRDVSDWQGSGDVQPETRDQRLHGLQGAVAVPSINPLASPVDVASDRTTVLGPLSLGSIDATEPVVLGQQLLNYLQQLALYVQQLQATFNAHTHLSEVPPTATDPTLPPAPLAAPSPAPPTSAILSTRHKVD